MKALKWVVALFFLAGILGCTYAREYMEIVRGDAVSGEYFDTLNRHTQEKTLYSEFETRIRVVATWKTPEFTDAYLSEYARLYHLTGEAEEERRDLLSGASSGLREFIFYAYTPDRDSNDFSKADSIWKVFSLREGGERADPVEIREIKASPLVTKFFPYVKPYGKFYSVKFPILPLPGTKTPPDQDSQTLVFTGVLGKVELKWKGGKNP
ncbi:MAG: hypothetical protein E4H15_03180 [Syntrophobacterales bacterium]|nr:MAG: hypothetical protein E4H15_03180 [Syntrophobacterales bacterium]